MTDAYRLTKTGHMSTLISRAKRRAKDEGLPFNLTLDYMKNVPSEECPIFGTKLAWCASQQIRSDDSPSIDKIDPLLGYVEGNVAWVSWRANRIKNDGTAEEHIRIATWMYRDKAETVTIKYNVNA